MRKLIIGLAVIFSLAACGDDAHQASDANNNELSLAIDGWTFVGPSEVKSGWTRVKVNNDSGMIHHAVVYRLPDGVTDGMMAELVIKPLQESLTARLAGDMEKAGALLATIPAWMGQIDYFGGPGMMSDGIVGEATMYLEPGNYIVECYVKTNGMQHNYSPDPGVHAMVHPFTVSAEAGDMAEPDANVTLEIDNSGFAIVDGAFVPGNNSVRVNFVEQRRYNGFIGHDAHLFRIDADTDIEAAARWMDPFSNDGQETPGPVHYVGGIHDMPQGATGYFTVTLSPGDYGIVAEIPDTQGQGYFERFTVSAE